MKRESILDAHDTCTCNTPVAVSQSFQRRWRGGGGKDRANAHLV